MSFKEDCKDLLELLHNEFDYLSNFNLLEFQKLQPRKEKLLIKIESDQKNIQEEHRSLLEQIYEQNTINGVIINISKMQNQKLLKLFIPPKGLYNKSGNSY
jgi:flagellar biosynthesis/type III secretory pathway chaperone